MNQKTIKGDLTKDYFKNYYQRHKEHLLANQNDYYKEYRDAINKKKR